MCLCTQPWNWLCCVGLMAGFDTSYLLQGSSESAFLLEQALKILRMFLKEMVSPRAAAIRIKCFILLPISGVAMRAEVRSRVCRGQKKHQNSSGFKTKTKQGGRRQRRHIHCIHCFSCIWLSAWNTDIQLSTD